MRVLPVLMLILLVSPAALCLAQGGGETHEIRVIQMETPKRYIGLSYVEIYSVENDTLIYSGYLMNRTIVLNKLPESPYYDAWSEVNNTTCKIVFRDHLRSYRMVTVYISLEADYIIGKTENEKGGNLTRAKWWLPPGTYRVRAIAYTNEDEEKYRELDMKYPSFVYEKVIDLKEDTTISMFFTPTEELPVWADIYIFLKENRVFLILLCYLIATISLVGYGYVLSLRRGASDEFPYRKLYALLLLPATIFIPLSLWLVSLDLRYRVLPFVCGVFLFLSMLLALVYMWIKLDAKFPRAPKIGKAFRNSAVLHFAVFIYSSIMWSVFSTPIAMCYVLPMYSPWKPTVPKIILLYPLLLVWLRRRRLRRKLISEGIYREEWDEA